MSKIPSARRFPAIPHFRALGDIEAYLKALGDVLFSSNQESTEKINGQLDTSNLMCTVVTVPDTGNANTEFEVAHNLGIATVYYLSNINTSPGGDVTFYKDSGGTAWTENSLYLKCTRANQNVTFLVLA
jgi:hypothetical protein